MHPLSFWTSLMVLGAFMLLIVEIFSGLASMQQRLMMNPSSFPDGTLKMHLLGVEIPLVLLQG